MEAGAVVQESDNQDGLRIEDGSWTYSRGWNALKKPVMGPNAPSAGGWMTVSVQPFDPRLFMSDELIFGYARHFTLQNHGSTVEGFVQACVELEKNFDRVAGDVPGATIGFRVKWVPTQPVEKKVIAASELASTTAVIQPTAPEICPQRSKSDQQCSERSTASDAVDAHPKELAAIKEKNAKLQEEVNSHQSMSARTHNVAQGANELGLADTTPEAATNGGLRDTLRAMPHHRFCIEIRLQADLYQLYAVLESISPLVDSIRYQAKDVPPKGAVNQERTTDAMDSLRDDLGNACIEIRGILTPPPQPLCPGSKLETEVRDIRAALDGLSEQINSFTVSKDAAKDPFAVSSDEIGHQAVKTV